MLTNFMWHCLVRELWEGLDFSNMGEFLKYKNNLYIAYYN